MAKEPTWKTLSVASTNVKNWRDLGIGPKDFSILRRGNLEFFAKGGKEESDRVWKLIGVGYSLKRLLALAEDDSRRLGYLLALMKLNKEITPERLSRYEDISWKLDVLLATEVAEWVELGLNSDQLDSLVRLDVIDSCDETGLETVREVLSQLRSETTAKSVDECLELIRDLAARFGTTRVRNLVELGELASVVSDIQVADEAASERDLFESGHFGDWAGIGISQRGMDFYMTHFFEHCDDAEVLVGELRLLLSLGYSHEDMYSEVQQGFKYSQIQAMRAAGLPINRRTIDDWYGATDPKVILFFVDNGFTTDDRSDILVYWNLGIDLIEPWWEFCKKQNWIANHSRSQLINGVDYDDLANVPQLSTVNLDTEPELLDLDSYLKWREHADMHNKFSEIQRWRQCGFEPETADRALEWKKLKFSPSEAALWIKALKQVFLTVYPEVALSWKQIGVSPESVPDWIRSGVVEATEAAAWIQSGANAETAATRKKAGISPPNS